MRHALSWLVLVACGAPSAPSKVVAPATPAAVSTTPAASPAISGEVSLEQLALGQAVHGFAAKAVYLDGGDKPIGARLVHAKTGFTLDYLRIESAPRLEEKGTVYNEMVRAYEGGDTLVYRRAWQLVYGAQHPLALDSGGYPEAIRTMTPEDIRRFHDATYHLANMGMVGAFPSSMP